MLILRLLFSGFEYLILFFIFDFVLGHSGSKISFLRKIYWNKISVCLLFVYGRNHCVLIDTYNNILYFIFATVGFDPQ